MIEIKNITKKYGNKVALNDVSLNISKGENVAIIGANGSGKSTLVEIISGIQKPSSGSVKMSKNIDDIIGIQFQEGNWPTKTRPLDLIKFFKGQKWSEDKYVADIFEIFEIEEIYKRDINKLSLGQRQRLNCFLAIINDPSLVVIDELITGLDLRIHLKLLSFFEKMKESKEKTLLIVSHIPDEIETLCDRLIVMKDGSIYEDIKLNKVIDEHKTVKNFLENHFRNSKVQNEIKN
ncbi:ATP-binding cassette domain-containing protein [Spiroplasma apis]|uniref:Peptide/nickel transport system ATP-binding protein n=1 Tax=Spiroplasma apis B31 TaxID=1276258 RepID=V5RK42_SPIAP|nr:ATP-binding cassette domain-containing protein [Spiroplasma apis]AHB36476.1 peptide/nickel transport system ATP-binding protein [Spiroplasma apis B31]